MDRFVNSSGEGVQKAMEKKKKKKKKRGPKPALE